jgi:hypothetical protein
LHSRKQKGTEETFFDHSDYYRGGQITQKRFWNRRTSQPSPTNCGGGKENTCRGGGDQQAAKRLRDSNLLCSKPSTEKIEQVESA